MNQKIPNSKAIDAEFAGKIAALLGYTNLRLDEELGYVANDPENNDCEVVIDAAFARRLLKFLRDNKEQSNRKPKGFGK